MDNENPIGAIVNIPVKTRDDFSFFSESQSRIVLSISEKNKKEFEEILSKRNQKFTFLGKTGGDKYSVNNDMEFLLSELIDIYFNTISQIMND